MSPCSCSFNSSTVNHIIHIAKIHPLHSLKNFQVQYSDVRIHRVEKINKPFQSALGAIYSSKKNMSNFWLMNLLKAKKFQYKIVFSSLFEFNLSYLIRKLVLQPISCSSLQVNDGELVRGRESCHFLEIVIEYNMF